MIMDLARFPGRHLPVLGQEVSLARYWRMGGKSRMARPVEL